MSESKGKVKVDDMLPEWVLIFEELRAREREKQRKEKEAAKTKGYALVERTYREGA